MIQVLTIDPLHPEEDQIQLAADALHQEKLVAFPTETVYGLGAIALDSRAVARIFEAKGRPNFDPLIVHIAESSWLERVASEISPIAWRLAEAFWPGPLTLILPKRREVPDEVTAGLGTVAVRVPAHPIALALLYAVDDLVAAPSANRFGHTSPTQASHVLSDLGDRIDMLIDGGDTRIGIESTVLDLTGSTPTILRPGGVTLDQLIEVQGNVRGWSGEMSAGPQVSPGLLMQHYSPRAELVFLTGHLLPFVLSKMHQLIADELGRGRRVGILALEEDIPAFDGLPIEVASLGNGDDLWQAAHRLFAGMRSLDKRNVDVIFVRDPGQQGPGLAICDRLQRAATKIISS
jgi:L-threonylcarbamoyladenylate synthase